MNRSIRLLVLLLVLSCAWGCASTTVVYAPRQLRAEMARRIDQRTGPKFVVPFEITPDMAEYARRVTSAFVDDRDKVQELIRRLTSMDGLGLQYDVTQTGTAIGTLEQHAGDCLSFTSLFIGLARAAGVETLYVEARGVQEYATEGTLVIDRRHVVAGFGKRPVFSVVDFDKISDRFIQYRILTDLQATARYYNNMGYVALKEDRNQEALDYFRAAVKLDPIFPGAHNNYGVALSRVRNDDEAEEEFRAALHLDSAYSAAMVNLSALLQRKGRKQEALEIQEKVGHLRELDPLWRLKTGTEALEAGKLDDAVRELETAVALDPRLGGAWVALAKAYLAKSDEAGARRALNRALRAEPMHREARQLRDQMEAKAQK